MTDNDKIKLLSKTFSLKFLKKCCWNIFWMLSLMQPKKWESKGQVQMTL